MHGRFLRDTLTAAGIDVTGLVLSPDVFTTLAFVALDDRGERHFSFARKPGADTCLRSDELPAPLLSSARVLHVGSLSLTDEPARSATFAAVEAAKRAGAVISYDPNYRAALWPDEAAAAAQMRSMVPYADVMKLSDEETLLLTGAAEPEEAAHRLLAQGVSCVAVTLGERGALVAVAGGMQTVPAFSSDPVDTTGAGDGFWGGFLHRMLTLDKRPAALTVADAADCARWGNATAALCITRRGGIPAMPALGDVQALLLR